MQILLNQNAAFIILRPKWLLDCLSITIILTHNELHSPYENVVKVTDSEVLLCTPTTDVTWKEYRVSAVRLQNTICVSLVLPESTILLLDLKISTV